MTYKCIVCDLDETLLDENSCIPQKNIDFIKKAINEYNIKFVPATGRPRALITSYLKEINLFDKNEYVLSLNGAILSENKDNQIIQSSGIEKSKVIELIEFGLQHDVCIELHSETDIYVYRLTEQEEIDIFIQTNTPYIEKTDRNYDYLNDINILKLVYEKRDNEYLHSIVPLMDKIRDNLNISFSSYRYIEINSSLIDKGKGLMNLAKYLNIDRNEIIAIGDNYNDESMLKVAGLSCAPSNAIINIQKMCDYVSPFNNNEGAVADIIEKFIFK